MGILRLRTLGPVAAPPAVNVMSLASGAANCRDKDGQ
jgi:hypothetical protein